MKLNFKNLPITNLPYDNITLCKQMMLRLFENIPYLPELPKIDPNDTTLNRTIKNIKGIKLVEKKLIIEDSFSASFIKSVEKLDKDFNYTEESQLNDYSIDSEFMDIYIEMLKRIQPEYTLIKLIGPYSLGETIFNVNTATLLKDKLYRKFLIQSVGVKALWFINKVKSISPNTKVIVLLDEQQLYKFGTLKRTHEDITKETVTSLFTKLYQRIKKCGGIVGVQSFEKCNWQLVLDSDVDLISFAAYSNSSSLNIIAEKVSHFLAKGGYINWAIIPVNNETVIRNLNIDKLNKIFTKAIEDFSLEGISLDLLYRSCTVSVQGNLSQFPILFAEKALMLESQLSKKIPSSSRL